MTNARSIFVVERHDRQPFALQLARTNPSAPAGATMVLGVGFPTMEGAEKFLHETLKSDHETFAIQPLIEGPIAPIYASGEPPTPNQVN